MSEHRIVTCRMCDEKIKLDKNGYWIHTADGEWHCRKHPASVAIPDDGSR